MGQVANINEESREMEKRVKLQNFSKLLNKDPNPEEVRVNQHAGNSMYLPISYVEMLLDEMFFGLWETRDFRYQVIANEIIGSIVLRVFHPTAGEWIERTGASATMIRQTKGAGLTEYDKKIHNALEMDFPHLKADCLVNAAKSLGKAFGRDLNRKFFDVYRPLITGMAIQQGAITAQVQQDQELEKAVYQANMMLEQARMDDQTLQSITMSLAECENAGQVRRLYDIIGQYIPNNDPQKQFVQRSK